MMIRDNGLQMVGAHRELLKKIEGWDIGTLRDYADKGMQPNLTYNGKLTKGYTMHCL